MAEKKLKHFYIAEEQSIYLMSHKDATKLKEWVELCKQQLSLLGYVDISLIGKGAYGFVFGARDELSQHLVFKFSRINLPQHVQDRLAEEAEIQGELSHPRIPKVIEYYKIKRQSIVHMQRAPGVDLEKYSFQNGPLPPETIVKIAIQLAELLLYLRNPANHPKGKPYVHGDIKPSNIMFNENTGRIYLIDWGSAVNAQLDIHGHTTANNIMDLMSSDLQNSNARLGDVYFIGPEQLNGEMSSPRFDEQGMAATLYALASGQSCRYGKNIIPPASLGLPKLLANILEGMLSDDKKLRDQAGDYFFKHLALLKNTVLAKQPTHYQVEPLIPVWGRTTEGEIDTVVYGSRKSFLREESDDDELSDVDDAQLEKYYKNFLMGMGDTEKAFVAAVSRLGEFPIVGGLAIHWQGEQLSVESNLNLFDESFKTSAVQTVDSIIDLARSLDIRSGIFKSCLFDAKDTIHVERKSTSVPFVVANDQSISFDISDVPETDENKQHSYFEDGDDPDEKLVLPAQIMEHIIALNDIRHTGCIIFEVLPKHLKIHNYYVLLDKDRYAEFKSHLQGILDNVQYIDGLGVSGFMKLPYKDTKTFDYQTQRQQLFCPTDTRMLRE